jgi:hypothetical protein
MKRKHVAVPHGHEHEREPGHKGEARSSGSQPSRRHITGVTKIPKKQKQKRKTVEDTDKMPTETASIAERKVPSTHEHADTALGGQCCTSPGLRHALELLEEASGMLNSNASPSRNGAFLTGKNPAEVTAMCREAALLLAAQCSLPVHLSSFGTLLQRVCCSARACSCAHS